MFSWCGVFTLVDGHAQMPFAEVSSGVALVPEDFGEGDLAWKQMHPVNRFTDDGVDSRADVVAAGQEGGARRGADRGSRMKVGETHAFGGQLVENRSLDGAAIAANVAIA